MIGSSLSHDDIALNCSFSFDVKNEYTCYLSSVVVLDRSANVTFTGDHLDGRTNEDVKSVAIILQNTPFVIPQIFESFPNIKRHEIFMAQLQDVEMPGTSSLEELEVRMNNVSRIQNGAFRNVTQLRRLVMFMSYIEHIEEGAFEGLAELTELLFYGNRFTQLNPTTFDPLVSVKTIHLEFGWLDIIVDGLFATNKNLQTLSLNYNYIEKITPNFARTISETKVNFLGLRNRIDTNPCVHQEFHLVDEFNFMGLNSALRKCYLNYE
jgi:Leucine-rich repeat (LRR) protein